jgi:hypothetical protein
MVSSKLTVVLSSPEAFTLSRIVVLLCWSKRVLETPSCLVPNEVQQSQLDGSIGSQMVPDDELLHSQLSSIVVP